MKNTVISYPDELPGLLKLSDKEFTEEIRFIISAKFFELGKLSSGKAAQICGLPKVEFLRRLSQHGFSAINLDDEQVDLEIISARRI